MTHFAHIWLLPRLDGGNIKSLANLSAYGGTNDTFPVLLLVPPSLSDWLFHLHLVPTVV